MSGCGACQRSQARVAFAQTELLRLARLLASKDTPHLRELLAAAKADVAKTQRYAAEHADWCGAA